MDKMSGEDWKELRGVIIFRLDQLQEEQKDIKIMLKKHIEDEDDLLKKVERINVFNRILITGIGACLLAFLSRALEVYIK